MASRFYFERNCFTQSTTKLASGSGPLTRKDLAVSYLLIPETTKETGDSFRM